MKEGSSEFCIHNIFMVGAWAKSPLELRLPKLKELGIPISFFYGEKDFMDIASPRKLIDEGLVDGSVHIISNSDHHVFLTNPKELVQKIVAEVFGEHEALLHQEL
mmetsp:Transcript_4347/g.4114  ORF Transcript_4347/g.4114 Transcript_4347/m.4114 type:complete len:105 (-) Transcript_4347:201-515(-)